MICLLIAFIYLLRAKPIYTSSASVLVEQKGPKIITTDEGFMTQSKNYLNTQCVLLKSTPIVSDAVEYLKGRPLPTFNLSKNPTGFIKSGLEVTVGKKDDVITIFFDSHYPQEAAEIVSAVVLSYFKYHSTQHRDTASKVRNILLHELTERDKALSQRLKDMMEFKQKNAIIALGTKNSNIIIQRLSKLSDSLTNAELEVVDIRAQHEVAKAIVKDASSPTSLPASQMSWGGEKGFSQINSLQFKLAALQQEYTSDHPVVRIIESQIKQIARQWISSLQAKYLIANNRMEKLQELVERQEQLAQKLNYSAAKYEVLEAKLRRTQQLCETLDDRIKAISVTEEAGALNIRILEEAKIPESPSKPRKGRVLAIALVFGLLVGIGGALLMEQLDHRFRSVEDISQALDLPILGTVPNVSSRKESVNVARMVDLQPSSQIAEAYRTIRTALYFGVPEGKAKTILVTSPAPRDGKSTIVSNLAIAMAQAGEKILVLDADFRRPRQHRIFNLENEDFGLSNVLAGRGSVEEAIQPSGIDKLDILPCGTIPPNPSEMLNSPAFGEFLQQLTEQYDHVMLDAPPVMPVTDSRILGAICDVTVLVLRADKSSRNPTLHAIDSLLAVGTHILGVVVNSTPTGRGGYGYYSHYGGYGYYGGYYGYGRDSREERKRKEKDVAATARLLEQAR